MYGADTRGGTIIARFTAIRLWNARKTGSLRAFCIKKRRLKSFLKRGLVNAEELPIMRLH
ncbi:hypothetical protein CHU32_18070 [Superficieibacter electus]|uniref:Uncharacterized protein n=1 Tax=Superficieibacter electus TaxID=2022662 RepID=A0A2P5GLA7_9ENTR|nr:hypothetical protein CHU32_18070 [Superficieibacter electus]